MAKRGRKAVKPPISRYFWLMVELARDRKEWGRPRESAREATHRLAKEMAAYFPDGRVPPGETIHRYHEEFERVMRQGGEEANSAKVLLDIARWRRDQLGWDTSIWLLVFDPWMLEELGCKVVLTAK